MIASSLPSRKRDILIAFPPPHYRKKTVLRDKGPFQFLKSLRSTIQSLFKTRPFKFICWNSRRGPFPPSKVSTCKLQKRKDGIIPRPTANLLEKAKNWALRYCLYSSLFKKAKFCFPLSGRGRQVETSDRNSCFSDSLQASTQGIQKSHSPEN